MIRIDDITGLNEIQGSSIGICEYHEKLFKTKIPLGIVCLKEIEINNHAIPRILIKTNNELYPIEFIDGKNQSDFKFISVGDTISKKSNSFVFTVNKKYKFLLMYRCDYNKNYYELDSALNLPEMKK